MAVVHNLPKCYAKALMRRGISFVASHPRIKRFVAETSRKLGLATFSCQSGVNDICAFTPTDIADLSPRERQIYFDLNAAIKRHRKAGL